MEMAQEKAWELEDYMTSNKQKERKRDKRKQNPRRQKYKQFQKEKDRRIEEARRIEYPEQTAFHYENEKTIEDFFRKKKKWR